MGVCLGSDAVRLPKSKDIRASRDSNAEYVAKLTSLRKVPLLRNLPKEKMPLLAAVVVERHFNDGETVVKQGEVGSSFFLIKVGQAKASAKRQSGSQATVMMEGDYFGEQALMFNAIHPVTITAIGNLTCFEIEKSQIDELKLLNWLSFPKRRAVRGSSTKDMRSEEAPEITSKTPEDTALIVSSMMQNSTLGTLNMTAALATEMAASAWSQEVKEGTELIKQGEEGTSLFVVASGAFDVFKEGNNGRSEKVGCMNPGKSFGELALMYSAKRAATVKATMKSCVWIIDSAVFKRTMMKNNKEEINEYMAYLNNCQAFNSLLHMDKWKVASALRPVNFMKDDIVFEQDADGSSFYILREGEVDVIINGKQTKTLSASVKSKTVQYFGERALLHNQPRAATVKVISEEANALILEKAIFEEVLAALKEDFDAWRGSTLTQARATKARTGAKPSLEKLTLIGVLGAGAFGKVELRKNQATGKCYAVKILSKGYIVKLRMQAQLVNEVQVLLSVSTPFIIELAHTNKDSNNIYLFMEPCLGGELWTVYARHKLTGDHATARYYAASVVFALDHLHERYVIYRDLKPENLLLDAKGRLKLTDMGLAKFTLGKSYTTCGTPEYFAPEVIRSTGQTRAVDWWTLGILIFELMVGATPFKAMSDSEMFAKVIAGIDQIPFPPAKRMENIVKALLQSDPSKRLPMRAGGIQNLKDDPWFENFDWEALADLRLTPPYKPDVQDDTDIKNFHAARDCAVPFIPYKDDGSGWDKDL